MTNNKLTDASETSRPMSNIDKHALRGQSVEGSFYLAECGYCGQVMPSSKLRVLHSQDGEADCYCPHCNAEDCELFDLGTVGSEVVNAWNYQQKRIEALLDELEAKDKSWAAQDDHINQQADRIESLEKKNGELGRALGAADRRIAELEASHGNLREAMAGIHNTITGGGAYTPLSAILNASKRAYDESAAAAGKGE